MKFGVQAVGRSDEGSDLAGVWIGDEKVAAIGVHVAKGVTTHGFALNVTAEPLPFFERIVPCGLSATGHVRIASLFQRRPPAIGRPRACDTG